MNKRGLSVARRLGWENADVRTEVLWRVALVQLVAVAVLSLLLGLVFSHGCFESWGWLVGPAAWLGCAWVTARVVGLEPGSTVVRALLAGLVSVLAVIVGLHWLGLLIAVGLFAYLCAREPREPAAWT
jgi:hypothetical protein